MAQVVNLIVDLMDIIMVLSDIVRKWRRHEKYYSIYLFVFNDFYFVDLVKFNKGRNC